MSKKTKIWLSVALLLIVIGGGIFTAVMANLGWDFKKLSTTNMQTNVIEITDNFNSISYDGDTTDIEFIATDEEINKVVCFEEEKINHLVEIVDAKLVIKVVDDRAWYEKIGINFSHPKITVYLSKGEYENLTINSDTSDIDLSKGLTFKSVEIAVDTGDVKIKSNVLESLKVKTSTGDILVEDITANTIELSVTTGDIDLLKVNCKAVISNGDTGDITLKEVIATEKFLIERSTGDVEFINSDAGEIKVKTSTGDVEGSLLSEKIFLITTETGDKRVPYSTSGGPCEITTSTGDIRITIN